VFIKTSFGPIGQFLKIDLQQKSPRLQILGTRAAFEQQKALSNAKKTPALAIGGRAFDCALVVPPPVCLSQIVWQKPLAA